MRVPIRPFHDTSSSARDFPAPLKTGKGREGRKSFRSRSKICSLFVAHESCLKVAVFLGTFFAISWAWSRHYQRPQNTLVGGLAARLKIGLPELGFKDNPRVGFRGDSSSYGLGIRLGVYLHWLTDLIQTAFLKEEEQEDYVSIAHGIFGISIPVALFLNFFTAAFSSAYTFPAEVFIALVLFWGSYYIAQIPTMQAVWQRKNKSHERQTEMRVRFKLPPRSSRRLRWSTQLLAFVVSPITIWFWAHVANGFEGLKCPCAPNGTSYFFFFARLQGRAAKDFGRWMALASMSNVAWHAFTSIPTRLVMLESESENENESSPTGDDGGDEKEEEQSTYVVSAGPFPFNRVFWPFVLILGTLDVFLRIVFTPFIVYLVCLLLKWNGIDINDLDRQTGIAHSHSHSQLPPALLEIDIESAKHEDEKNLNFNKAESKPESDKKEEQEKERVMLPELTG